PIQSVHASRTLHPRPVPPRSDPNDSATHVPGWRSQRSRSTVITPNVKTTPTLFCDGVRPHLELHNLRPCALAAFLVPRRVHRVARPEPAAFPAGLRVVDPSGRMTSGESQRVRYA